MDVAARNAKNARTIANNMTDKEKIITALKKEKYSPTIKKSEVSIWVPHNSADQCEIVFKFDEQGNIVSIFERQ